jgi:hypothetical protein
MQEIMMNKIIPISKKAQKNYGWLDIQPYPPATVKELGVYSSKSLILEPCVITCSSMTLNKVSTMVKPYP